MFATHKHETVHEPEAEWESSSYSQQFRLLTSSQERHVSRLSLCCMLLTWWF